MHWKLPKNELSTERRWLWVSFCVRHSCFVRLFSCFIFGSLHSVFYIISFVKWSEMRALMQTMEPKSKIAIFISIDCNCVCLCVWVRMSEWVDSPKNVMVFNFCFSIWSFVLHWQTVYLFCTWIIQMANATLSLVTHRIEYAVFIRVDSKFYWQCKNS